MQCRPSYFCFNSAPNFLWCCSWFCTRNMVFAQVASYNGWEYAVLERELGAHRDPSRKMLVTVRMLTIIFLQIERSRSMVQSIPHESSAAAQIRREARPCVL